MFKNLTDESLYVGQMASGDRLATQEEIDAWELKLKPKPIDQIRAIEARPEVIDANARASRQLLLKTWFDRAKALPSAAALTDAQVEDWCRANDKTYKVLAEAEDAIKPLRALV